MADEKQDTRGELAPFQIKAFSVAVRKRIVAAVANEKTTVGEWVEQAALNQLERERGQMVLPPATVGASMQPYERPEPDPQPPINIDLGGLAQLIVALGGGDAVPAALRRDVVASARAVLRRSQGLPPRHSRPKQKVIEG